jgi:hypothetical protein
MALPGRYPFGVRAGTLERPYLRRSAAWCAGGRLRRCPLARTAANPSLVPFTINSRMNSAKEEGARGDGDAVRRQCPADRHDREPGLVLGDELTH